MRIHIDLETRCRIDLLERGLMNYVTHPSFEIISTAWAVDDGPVQQRDGFVRFDGPEFQGAQWHAFNAAFEIAALRAYGACPPVQRWHCTMTHAYARGFSGGLKNVGEQVGLPPNRQKLAEGRDLIRTFCVPRVHTATDKADWWDKTNAPDKWKRFAEYNKQDVVSEREIWRLLNAWGPETQEEREDWILDRKINDLGLPVDAELARQAVAMAKRLSDDLDERVRLLTGGIGANQVGKLLAWGQHNGYPGKDLRAETIREYLNEPPF